MEPVKKTVHQVSRDQVWRQLDRQEWICTGGKVFGQVGRNGLIKICMNLMDCLWTLIYVTLLI